MTRRLTPTERDLLRSGQVFVWEEGSSSGGGAEDGTPSAGLERWTDGRRWYVRTIRLLDPISCRLLSLPTRLTIVPGHSRVCASHSSSMKRKYKPLKKKSTKRPFDAPVKHPPPRIPTRLPTILQFVARIDLPSQTDSQNKLIRVSICASGSGGRLLVSFIYTDLLPFHLLLTFRFDTPVYQFGLSFGCASRLNHPGAYLKRPVTGAAFFASNIPLGLMHLGFCCTYELSTFARDRSRPNSFGGSHVVDLLALVCGLVISST